MADGEFEDRWAIYCPECHAEIAPRGEGDPPWICPNHGRIGKVYHGLHTAHEQERTAMLAEIAALKREDRTCSCAMTETSARLCPVHGEDAPPL